MNVPRYKRVPTGREPATRGLTAYGHLWLPHGSPTIILKRLRRQEYYVVGTSDWFRCYRVLLNEIGFAAAPLDDIAELALHQTAERFDTLEQAMLYFAATT